MLAYRSFSFVLVAALAATLSLSTAARAANSAPAITAFKTAFAGINDYTVTLTAHEALADKTQNRTYSYQYLKPSYAKTLILKGDGEGSGGVWSGGDTVSGHQGGILSGLHLTVSIHDPRAVSLRGYTIPDGLVQNIIDRFVTTPGTLTQAAGGKIGGVATDRLDLKVSDPSSNGGVSEQIIYLSQETHLPIREILYAGQQIVLDQTWSDWKTNVGLTQSNF